MMHTKKILIVGAGYVGLAYTCFFSQKFNVTVLDIDHEKVKRIKDGKSYTKELLIGDFLKKYKNNIKAKDVMNNFSDYDVALMCLPTDYDEKSNFFDTKILSDEIERIFKNDFNLVNTKLASVNNNSRCNGIYWDSIKTINNISI